MFLILLLHGKIIWKCLATVDWKTFESCNHSWSELRKRRRTSSLKFLPWNINFPWKEASIRITRVCFHQRNLKFFTDKTWKNGTEGKGFFRRRISNSISNPRKCTYRGIWRRLRRVNRYVSTIYLHTSATSRARRERKVLFLHLYGENFGPEPWNNSFRREKLQKRILVKSTETNEDESWIFRY